MKSLIEGSILFRFIYRIFKWLNNAYNTSIIKKMSLAIKSWYSFSMINHSISNYMIKPSKATLSVTYKILSFIGSKLDLVVGKFSGFILDQIRTSSIVSTSKAISFEFKERPGSAAAVLFIPLIIGFSLVTTVKNSWSMDKLAYIILMLILGIVLFIGLDRWKAWFKNSIIYRVCHYIWE